MKTTFDEARLGWVTEDSEGTEIAFCPQEVCRQMALADKAWTPDDELDFQRRQMEHAQGEQKKEPDKFTKIVAGSGKVVEIPTWIARMPPGVVDIEEDEMGKRRKRLDAARAAGKAHEESSKKEPRPDRNGEEVQPPEIGIPMKNVMMKFKADESSCPGKGFNQGAQGFNNQGHNAWSDF